MAGAMRLLDRKRWASALYETTIWLMFGFMVTTLLSRYAPGYLALVGSQSIPRGVYWVDTTDKTFRPGDYASFHFEPRPAWLQERYGKSLQFTKQILGVEGYTIHVDTNRNLRVCSPAGEGVVRCYAAGQAPAKDQRGRKLTSWVPPGKTYTLKRGEVWFYGPHKNSLDSRYAGPLPVEAIYGQAHPLLTLDSELPRRATEVPHG